MSAPIRVAIADDHALFVAGLQMVVDSVNDMTAIGTALTGPEAYELAVTSEPDVMLMDIRMPGTDGISVTARLSDELPNVRAIVLTTHHREDAVTHAIDAGAHGFLLKDARPELLLAAIRTVHEGSSVFAPPTTTALIRDLTPAVQPDPDTSVLDALTPREREVYLLAARGLSNKQIAESAFISDTTVKSHISSVLGKLGLASRLQLIAHAHRHALVR